jgi:hypothetical protein
MGFKKLATFLVVEPSRILRMNKDHGQTHLVQNLQEQQQRQATMTDGLLAGGGGGRGHHRTNGHTRQQGTNKFEKEVLERRPENHKTNEHTRQQGTNKFEKEFLERRPENNKTNEHTIQQGTNKFENEFIERRPEMAENDRMHPIKITDAEPKHRRGMTTQPHRKAWLDNRHQPQQSAHSRFQGRSGLDLFTICVEALLPLLYVTSIPYLRQPSTKGSYMMWPSRTMSNGNGLIRFGRTESRSLHGAEF